MSWTPFELCLICAALVGLISLLSSGLYRRDSRLTPELMSLVSFFPGLLIGSFALIVDPPSVTPGSVLAIAVKSVLYGFSFYYRYESLRKFGPFVGALMLGTQPVVVFLFGLAVLGERLTALQVVSLCLTTLALFLLAVRRPGRSDGGLSLAGFSKYYLLPTAAAAAALVWDRLFLRGAMPVRDFFALDRVMAIPGFFAALALMRGFRIPAVFVSVTDPAPLKRQWPALLALGMLFTLSTVVYNAALVVEKAAIVGLFRNSAYPVAALIGAFVFGSRPTPRQWASFALIFLAISIGY